MLLKFVLSNNLMRIVVNFCSNETYASVGVFVFLTFAVTSAFLSSEITFTSLQI